MTATERIRGRELQRIRRRIAKRDDGLCGRCREAGLTVPGREVDHKVPLFKGGEECDANRWLLCDDCHPAKTREDRGQKAKGADRNGWPTDPRHPWNLRKATS